MILWLYHSHWVKTTNLFSRGTSMCRPLSISRLCALRRDAASSDCNLHSTYFFNLNSVLNWELLAHLSSKCSWWAIVIDQCPSSVVRRAASTIALKAYSSYIPRPMDSKLGRKHRVTCRSKLAKFVPIGNPRCPWRPSWKSIFRFFSWTRGSIDSKLVRNHRGDL